MAKSFSFNKRQTIFKAFVESQFKCIQLLECLIIDIPTKKIKTLFQRVLRIVSDDNASTFGQLLDKERSFCIHPQNIQGLLIETCEALNDNSGSIVKELFVRNGCTINLQSKPELVIPSVNNILKVKPIKFWLINLDSLSVEIREDHSIFTFVTK